MMKSKNTILMTIVLTVVLVLIFVVLNSTGNKEVGDNTRNESLDKNYSGDDYEEIYLAGGCFWGIEEYMERINGVIDATSGYANGSTINPSYEDVLYEGTGHAETVHVKYDPDVIKFEEILGFYFKVINPTSINKQGNDVGSQYRTGIYYVDEEQIETIEKVIKKEQKNYEKEIVVEVEVIDNYYLAEEYHQDYLKKNPNGYCHIDLGLANDNIANDNLSIKVDVGD
jgi:peptide methionine sulfoxide reductase msrA/msrB